MLISPDLDTDHMMQKKSAMVGLTDIETSVIGYWNLFLYVNRRTDLLHTENDCTYIFLTVPCHERKKYTVKNKLMFIFKLLEKQQIILPLSNDFSFVYNSKFVTHRQAYYPAENDLEKEYINVFHR